MGGSPWSLATCLLFQYEQINRGENKQRKTNGQTNKERNKGKSTDLGLRHPSHLATPHVLSVLIVSPKDLSPEITTMSIPPGRLVLRPLKFFYPETLMVPPLQVKSTSLSLLSGTRPLGQWPSQVNCRVGPHGQQPGRQPAFPSNPIIHPREQLDWGESDDRWTARPDCADLIVQRVGSY